MPVPAAWLQRQRWYGANDRTLVGLEARERAEVGEGTWWLLLEARFADGTAELYQVFWDGERDVAASAPALEWLLPGSASGLPVRALEGEQSNTSAIVGDDVIVKVFRRVGEGPNLDAEVVRRLWDTGYRAIPEPLGECRRDGRDLAVARRYLRGAADGWALALLGGPDFETAMADLGVLTAELHRALAAAFGSAPGDAAAWSAAMVAALEATPEVPVAEALTRRFRRIGELADAGRAIRTHGDFHLGQLLRHQDRWFVLDFEGEPARLPAERLRPASPLVDVAGMVRSLAYAGAVAGRPESWAEGLAQRYVAAYLGAAEPDGLLPPEPSSLLTALIADKAVYELRYERANRPDWAWIPLQVLRQTAENHLTA
jgi:maltokinase